MIGEVAKLLGITPKAVRHYEKLGLLERPERSESGYRLYTAGDLLRLHRIKRLQSFGLSLGRIKGILGEGGSGPELRGVLETLLGEVEGQIEVLQQRRARLREMLAGENLEEADDEPYALKLAREYLGERLENVSPEMLEQEKRFWATLDAFRWPKGYRELQEALFSYLADRPEESEKLLSLEERLAALAGLPEDSPEVERLAGDYATYFEESPLSGELQGASDWEGEAIENVFSEVTLGIMSPAQKRCMELMQERLSGEGNT